MDNRVLWNPDPEQVQNTRMFQWIRQIHQRGLIDKPDYFSLHKWSVESQPEFYEELWKSLNIKTSKEPEVFFHGKGENFRDVEFYKGAKLNYAENLLNSNGKMTAVISVKENDDSRQKTFEELRQLVFAIARGLKKSGVKKGDRVAGVVPFCFETLACILATSALGAVWSSCSPDFGATGLYDRLSQVLPKVLFTVDGYNYNGKKIDIGSKINSLKDKLQSKPLVIKFPFLEKEIEGSEDFTSLNDFAINGADEFEFEQCDFNHPLFIMFSSGTTGMPKCIVHGQGGSLVAHKKEHLYHGDLKEGDRLLFFTTCGWMMMNWTLSGLACGATLITYDGSPTYPEKSRLWKIAGEYKATHLGTSPKYLQACGDSGEDLSKFDLSHLRTIFTTGSPLTKNNYEWIYQTMKLNVHLSSISGGTDILGCFVGGNPVLPVKLGEIQSPFLGMDVVAFNEDGEVIWNEKGELVCRKAFPNMPVEFLNDEDNKKYHGAYFHKFKNIWAHGDFIEFDEKTLASIIHGRCDATLNPGGVRIGASEIYNVLEKIPEISDAVVTGLNKDGDVIVVLFVLLKDGLSLDEELSKKIKAAIRSENSPRHVPGIIKSVSAIPVTISGKKMEIAVRNKIHGEPVKNLGACANPESFKEYACLL